METASILDAVRVGFASLDVSPSLQEEALNHLQTWLNEPRFIVYRAQILSMVERECWSDLLDGFYRTLPFGTGGRRGRVGIGPNNFNPWTLATSIQGHAEWLKHTRGESGLSVVIGYDVRCFSDLNGTLEAGLTTPIKGITSRNFAEIAAEIYAAHEITVYLPPEGSILSTPELSFAVRALEADGGLVISASHNPPDDNGSKFYHHHGGQLVPPFDEEMGTWVQKTDRIERMSLDRALANGLVREIPSSVHTEYIEANLSIRRRALNQPISVVFSPLHGTGDTTVAEALNAAGFDCTIEPTQAEHDGSFPSVPFRIPNPEQPATLSASIATADQIGATLVMACDPDADRLGVGVLHKGTWIPLTGNDIAALVCMAALEQHPSPEPIVFKTEVTSSLVTRIAESKGAKIIDDLLVGFKYIGEALYLLERKGRYRGIEASLEQFAVGVEESHGVLVHTRLRDKDAAGGALLLAELASQEAENDRTLIDTLHDALFQHGVVHNYTTSTIMKGAVGRSQIDDIMRSYRNTPPTEIGGRNVIQWYDRQDPTGPFGEILSETDRSSRNMLVYELEGNARIILRPSGTEPKVKIYAEAMGKADSIQQVGEIRRTVELEAQHLAKTFAHQMLQRAQISIPKWAMDIDDIVSIQEKIRWSTEIVPQFIERFNDHPEEAHEWLNNQLDLSARGLLRPGIESMTRDGGENSQALLRCFDS